MYSTCLTLCKAWTDVSYGYYAEHTTHGLTRPAVITTHQGLTWARLAGRAVQPRALLFPSRRGMSALEGWRAAGAPKPGRASEGTKEFKKSTGQKAVQVTLMGGQLTDVRARPVPSPMAGGWRQRAGKWPACPRSWGQRAARLGLAPAP